MPLKYFRLKYSKTALKIKKKKKKNQCNYAKKKFEYILFKQK